MCRSLWETKCKRGLCIASQKKRKKEKKSKTFAQFVIFKIFCSWKCSAYTLTKQHLELFRMWSKQESVHYIFLQEMALTICMVLSFQANINPFMHNVVIWPFFNIMHERVNFLHTHRISLIFSVFRFSIIFWFSNIFKGYSERTLAWNEFMQYFFYFMCMF